LWVNLADAYRWCPGDRAKSAETYDRAIRLTQDAIALNPNDAVARAIAAGCHAKRGETDAAQSQLRLALKLDPTNPVVLYQAAIVANIRGDRDGALTWLQRSIASGRAAADVAHDPEMANLRTDPRFQKALKAKS